jgi:hypothetical protein
MRTMSPWTTCARIRQLKAMPDQSVKIPLIALGQIVLATCNIELFKDIHW